MTTGEIAIEGKLYQFIRKYADEPLKMELLAFWGRHPNAKFSKLAIYHVEDCRKVDVCRALEDMGVAGLVDAHIYNGTPLYSLTMNEEKRRLVMKLATLGWDQQQLVLRLISKEIKREPP
jgi:hypothetical protein